MDWSYQLSCFQYSKVFETGFSDFDIQTVTELKMSFQNMQPKTMN